MGERIADVRSLCEAQRAQLARSLAKPGPGPKPVNVVTPEKKPKARVAKRKDSAASLVRPFPASPCLQ